MIDNNPFSKENSQRYSAERVVMERSVTTSRFRRYHQGPYTIALHKEGNPNKARFDLLSQLYFLFTGSIPYTQPSGSNRDSLSRKIDLPRKFPSLAQLVQYCAFKGGSNTCIDVALLPHPTRDEFKFVREHYFWRKAPIVTSVELEPQRHFETGETFVNLVTRTNDWKYTHSRRIKQGEYDEYDGFVLNEETVGQLRRGVIPFELRRDLLAFLIDDPQLFDSFIDFKKELIEIYENNRAGQGIEVSIPGPKMKYPSIVTFSGVADISYFAPKEKIFQPIILGVVNEEDETTRLEAVLYDFLREEIGFNERRIDEFRRRLQSHFLSNGS